MSAEHYSLHKDIELLHFEFYSKGPNGTVRKVIQFQEFQPDSQIYNLGFGDWDSEKNEVDDMVVTNNNDTQKILATVAKAVEQFMHTRPNATIFAQGSTFSRTRLYQMGIGLFLDEINERFKILGLKNNKWETICERNKL